MDRISSHLRGAIDEECGSETIPHSRPRTTTGKQGWITLSYPAIGGADQVADHVIEKNSFLCTGFNNAFSEVEYYALTAALRWYLHIPTVCKLQMGKTVNVTDFSDALALLGPKCN